MFTSTSLRRFVLLVLSVVLLAGGNVFAATPFTRAMNRGRAYVHRPYYKSYQQHHRFLFGR